jgi:N-acetylglutamate synthase-like GNAT family acetyltransferase
MPDVEYRTEMPHPVEYAALFESAGWNDMYRCSSEELEVSLRHSWCVLTAYCNGELVGAGRLVSDGVLYAVVFDMIIAPHWRNRGVGTEILSRLLHRCETAGIRDVLLFSAKGTEGFYRRKGFKARPENAPGMIFRLQRPFHGGRNDSEG